MRSVWKKYRDDRRSWYVYWLELNPNPQAKKKWLERSKSFNNKKLAEHFQKVKYTQINSDIFTGQITISYDGAIEKYIEFCKRNLIKKSTVKGYKIAFNAFKKIVNPRDTSDVNQHSVDKFVIEMQSKDLSKYTIKTRLGRLKRFVEWGSFKKRRYMSADIEWPRISVPEVDKSSLTDDVIMDTLNAAPHDEWRLRIIMGLCTGLRRGDLFRLPLAEVDIKNAYIGTRQTKTSKYYYGPLPDDLMPALKKHVKSLPDEHPYFWKVYNERWLKKQWADFKPKGVTLQKLRQTFTTRIESIGISTAMLGHSSKQVTRQFYTDMDYIKYARVNQLPVAEWLQTMSRQ